MNKINDLLNWCKYQLDEYPNTPINNFTTSWKNGLAFNALIHRFKPDLVNFHELDSDNVYYNNYIAFKTAELHFGIPALLDPKDMSLLDVPERLSIITYVSQFYNCLKTMKPEGGYHINKFENTNNDNSDVETISSRASVHRLTKLKCSICKEKVYLLERYVADDKLYHRKCYRMRQIESINSESEVIGDYLNIYGELKPTMNKNIFVHPLSGMVSNGNEEQFDTHDPVSIYEESESEDGDLENLSESLSSYENSESASVANSEIEQYLSDKEREPGEDYIESIDFNDLKQETGNQNSFSQADEENIPAEKSVDTKIDEPDEIPEDQINKCVEDDEEPVQPCCQENLVQNITDNKSVKPLKQRLYIKKRDKELPYSTFFEVSYDEMVKLNNLNADCVDINEPPVTNVSEISSPKLKDTESSPVSSNNNTTSRSVSFKRKVIEITPEPDDDSDLSSIEENKFETVTPRITRNSIWRKPIISSVVTRKNKSACVPIEGKFRDYAEFKDRLQELNSKQFSIETQARRIQQKLWEEKSESSSYESLLTKWLDLVEEKDKIFYEENALYSWLKDLKLQEMKLKLEAQIRLLRADNSNDPSTSEKEKELIDKLIETVNRRSELVDAMHEENLRRMDIINLRNKALETSSGIAIDESDSKCGKPKPLKTTKKFWKRKTSYF